ncbi:MAG: T9SS type A sorting domain-containing protein [Bacteroidota bacterium]
MRNYSLLLLLSFISTAVFAQVRPWPATSPAPDFYGYTYETNIPTFDPNSTFDWVEIVSNGKGTEVSGMADDNVRGPIDIGFDFEFYWFKRDEVYIGSNGYVAFQNINIASGAIGFPPTPTADENNEFVAPLLADLVFGDPGNPGRVYTYSNGVDSFVVTYENVPFWNENTDFSGSNTFQVIFDGANSSIKFQYLSQQGSWSPTYNNTANPMVAGIENVSGTIGLMVSNIELPRDRSVIVFNYPANPGEIGDVEPSSIQNPETQGFFLKTPGAFKFKTTIGNVGTKDIFSQIRATAEVTDTVGNPFYLSSVTLDSLGSGSFEQREFAVPFNPPLGAGQEYVPYNLSVETTNSDDDNFTNDEKTVEAVAVAEINGKAVFSFCSDDNTKIDGAISWTGGEGNSGMGVFYEPYGYPARIEAVDVIPLFTTGTVADTNLFTLTIYGEDPTGTNVPGPLLYTDTVTISMIQNNAPFTRMTIANPPIISSGGFYVGWIALDSVSIASESAGPISRRTYEILNNTWATYRSNATADIFMKVTADVSAAVSCNISVTGTSTPDNGSNSGTATATVSSGTGQGPFTYLWDDPQAQTTATATGLEAGVYNCTVTDANSCTDIATVTVLSSVSIDEATDIRSLELYPNPTSGILQVRVDLVQAANVSLKVMDMQGRKSMVRFFNGSNTYTETLDLSELTAGVYLVQVNTPLGQETRKVVLK